MSTPTQSPPPSPLPHPSSPSSQSLSLEAWPRPLAFVLSGGGSYGAAQIGMLRALAEAGVVPDLVVGTSVGALNGAVVAADPAGAVDRLALIWNGLTRVQLFGKDGRFPMLWTYLRWRQSLCRPSGLQAVMDAWLRAERFDELGVPFAAVATDLATGEPTLLTTGSLAPALMASAAIPGVYPPVQVGDDWYIDGGVTANLPLRQAVAFGAQSLVVLNALPARLPQRVPNTIVGSLVRASVMMLRSQRSDAFDDLGGRYPVLHLPQVAPPSLSSFDFDHSHSLIDTAHSRAADLLASLAAAPAPTTV